MAHGPAGHLLLPFHQPSAEVPVEDVVFLGDSPIVALYLGNTQASALYLGDTLVGPV